MSSEKNIAPLTPNTFEFREIGLLIPGFGCFNCFRTPVTVQGPEANWLTWEGLQTHEFTGLVRPSDLTGRSESFDGHPRQPTLDLPAMDREGCVHTSEQRTDVRTA